MFYGGISAETQPFFVANSVIFSHGFHTLYLLKFTRFGLYSDIVITTAWSGTIDHYAGPLSRYWSAKL
jgi:hypothetical protein